MSLKKTVARDELRSVTDPRTLRALAHPVRLALIEQLSVDGPLTATELGERIGESPTTCSFHLRQLAKYDFVEEAGGGKGRARPWKMTRIGFALTAGGDAGPEAEIASAALSQLIQERQFNRYRTWQTTRGSYPLAWRDAASNSEHVIYLTTEELNALNDELLALMLPRFRERLTDRSVRPEGALPVEFLFLSFPTLLPPPSNGEN